MKIAIILAMCLAACGGGDDDFEAPSCADGEVRIEGTVDGESVSDVRTSNNGYIFVNALNDDEGQLDVLFGESGEEILQLRWPDLVANGHSVEARGLVGYTDLSVGTCEDDGYPGILRMDDEGGGGTFLLQDLRAGPVPCEGDPVDGELTGCFRSQPF